jgi:hypothetical protein
LSFSHSLVFCVLCPFKGGNGMRWRTANGELCPPTSLLQNNVLINNGDRI